MVEHVRFGSRVLCSFGWDFSITDRAIGNRAGYLSQIRAFVQRANVSLRHFRTAGTCFGKNVLFVLIPGRDCFELVFVKSRENCRLTTSFGRLNCCSELVFQTCCLFGFSFSSTVSISRIHTHTHVYGNVYTRYRSREYIKS